MSSTPIVAPGELTGTVIVPPRGAAGNNVLGPRIRESGTSEGKKRAGKEIARPLTTAIRYTTYANAFRRFLAHHADLKCGWRCVSSKSVLAYIGLGLKEAKLDDFKSGDEVPLTIKFKFVAIWILNPMQAWKLPVAIPSHSCMHLRNSQLTVYSHPAATHQYSAATQQSTQLLHDCMMITLHTFVCHARALHHVTLLSVTRETLEPLHHCHTIPSRMHVPY
jgi:hypothetical protein